MPTGTLMKKTQRQEKLSVMKPPSVGPDGRREDDGHAVDGHGHAALGRRERVGQDGLLARPEAAAADALQDAEEDQRAERRRHPAEERRDREERDAASCRSACARCGVDSHPLMGRTTAFDTR